MCEIKRLSQSEIGKIVNLRLKLWNDTGKIINDDLVGMEKINHEYFFRKMKTDDLRVYYIEFHNEIISIGAGCIIEKPPISRFDLGLEGYIFNMYTKLEYRNMGYATKIIESFFKYFEEKKVSKVTLGANENSLNLYKKLGFKVNMFHLEKIIPTKDIQH